MAHFSNPVTNSPAFGYHLFTEGEVNWRFAVCVWVAIGLIAVVPRVVAQSDEFEVASIRRSATNVGPWSTQHPADGRFSGQNLSARRLILQAFNIEATEFQLSRRTGLDRF